MGEVPGTGYAALQGAAPGEEGCANMICPQAADWEACLLLDGPFTETGCSRKEFFPAGIIARGIGVRSGLPCRCFDSSHAHSRGS